MSGLPVRDSPYSTAASLRWTRRMKASALARMVGEQERERWALNVARPRETTRPDDAKPLANGNIDEKVECYANILALVYLTTIFLALVIALIPRDKMNPEWQSSEGNASAYIQSLQAASLSVFKTAGARPKTD